MKKKAINSNKDVKQSTKLFFMKFYLGLLYACKLCPNCPELLKGFKDNIIGE